MSDRATYWSVTINNPTSSDEDCLHRARGMGWEVVGQIEEGDNGTPHYQLAVNTKSQQRFSALKKVFPRGHIEAARKPLALRTYVKKEETRIAELPNSERYVNSQKRLWELVTDELYRAPKEHRISMTSLEPWWVQSFDPIEALEYAGDQLIRKGYYCVESLIVNPQTKSAWKLFWNALIHRVELDRQTDRQTEESSCVVDIPTHETEEREDIRTTGSEESEDYEEGESETDEGYNEGSGDESSEEDSEQEY